MKKETQQVRAARESQEGRDLVMMALGDQGEYFTSAEVGDLIGETGYQAGKWLGILLTKGKVKRKGSGPGKYLFTTVKGTPLPAIELPKRNPDRYLVAWMVDGKGYGAVYPTEKEAEDKADEVAKEVPGTPVFIGKAYKRGFCPLPETKVEDY